MNKKAESNAESDQMSREEFEKLMNCMIACTIENAEMRKGMPAAVKPPLGEIVPHHQRWENTDCCLHCGKPEAEWGPYSEERCEKHVYGVNTVR